MKIHGILPPLLTPLQADQSLDLPATDRLVEHVIAGGVHGLFILGSTGEGPSLDYGQRRHFIAHVLEKVAGRIPVVVCISDTSCAESLSLAGHARSCGAEAVAFTPPYYFIPGIPELCDFVKRMGDGLSLPFFLYNMPALTKISLPADVVETAFAMPRCLGLKDSSGDLFYFKQMSRLAAGRDLSLFMGHEGLLAESLLNGARGGITGGANLFPRLYVEIYRLMSEGRVTEAMELQREVVELSSRLYTLGKFGSSIVKGLKGVFELRGLGCRHLADPFRGLHDDDMETLRSRLTDLQKRSLLAPYLRAEILPCRPCPSRAKNRNVPLG